MESEGVGVRVALWSVPMTDARARPVRLPQRRDFLEAHLERWIEADPSLVMEGLSWVGRQVVFPDRSRLDLVGLTKQGELIVAELKADSVGIGTLSQALHYALWIGALDEDALLRRLRLTEEQRELLAGAVAQGEVDVSILLVGMARLPELESRGRLPGGAGAKYVRADRDVHAVRGHGRRVPTRT